MEQKNRVSEDFMPLIREVVRKRFPRKVERIAAILAGADAPDPEIFQLEAQKEREIEAPEGDAWGFAFNRNATMLDRLACHGLSVGLTPTRMADGLLFTGRKITGNRRSLSEFLYPAPHRVGLESGMVVLLGDPANHPVAEEVLNLFAGYMVSNDWEAKISIFENQKNYIGYPVRMKTLRVKNGVKDGTYTPRRYMDENGMAMCYDDYGIILSAGLGALLKGSNPFGKHASHLILVSGLHRLATLAGILLLEDLDFRKFVLEGKKFNFPSEDSIGVLAYKIVVRTDNRLWSHVPDFRWSNSTVKEFEVLGDWQEPIHKLQEPRHGALKNVFVRIAERKPHST
jgi:hypothetical protein